MRCSATWVLACVVIATPIAAKPAFPLAIFGLPYAPETPRALTAEHPLYRKISVDPITNMPEKVGSFLAPITKRPEMDDALREMLDRANMLAPHGAPAKFRLSVRWDNLDAPAKISFSSHATAQLTYTLFRIDSGAQIFARSISTSTTAKGGDGTERLKGNARMALTTNLASVLVCLDKAAFGQAPADCALTPLSRFEAPRTNIIILP